MCVSSSAAFDLAKVATGLLFKIGLFHGLGHGSGFFLAAEKRMVQSAPFDLPGEPGPSVRRPPEHSTWARPQAPIRPPVHVRALRTPFFPLLQTTAARVDVSAGYRVSNA